MTSDDIKAVRALYQMSQAAFGRALGVTYQCIYSWERGTYEPKDCFVVILYKLWQCKNNPVALKRANAALQAAQFMNPVLEKSAPLDVNVELSGLGLIMSALFQSSDIDITTNANTDTIIPPPIKMSGQRDVVPPT